MIIIVTSVLVLTAFMAGFLGRLLGRASCRHHLVPPLALLPLVGLASIPVFLALAAGFVLALAGDHNYWLMLASGVANTAMIVFGFVRARN